MSESISDSNKNEYEPMTPPATVRSIGAADPFNRPAKKPAVKRPQLS